MKLQRGVHTSGPTGGRLKTPKAAAVAGIVFSVLLLTAFWLLRSFVPSDPLDSGEWLKADTSAILVGLNLIPFAGIAFLWFMGVLRDRFGVHEDRFFATVFFGSGLLCLALLFFGTATAGAIIMAAADRPEALINSEAFRVARILTYAIINIYLVKMEVVFVVSLSTIAMYTRIAPRSLAVLGYASSLVLLIGTAFSAWSFVAFPLWVLALSIYILFENLRRSDRGVPTHAH